MVLASIGLRSFNPAGWSLALRRQPEVVLDVTSFISAQDFILAQNRGEEPEDPFARQSYVEVTQSVLLQPRVLVLHPVLLSPTPDDFGQEPHLLRCLLRSGVVAPFQLLEPETQVASAEAELLSYLQTKGTRVLVDFIDQTLECDREQRELGGGVSLSDRLAKWNAFQARRVRGTPGHHGARIRTPDGIETDAFGDWSKSIAFAHDGALRRITADVDPKYLVAHLVRGLRFTARADLSQVTYQPSVLRRDFTLAFQLSTYDARADEVLNLIRAVRGIHKSISDAAGEVHSSRLKLLELEMPLLGGRIWQRDDLGKLGDQEWIELVAARLTDYRRRAAGLRAAIQSSVSEEDQVRISRDLGVVREQLLERLGFKGLELSPLERDLTEGVASVATAIPGVPKLSGVLLGIRAASKRLAFRANNPYQKFLYQEFVEGWEKSKR